MKMTDNFLPNLSTRIGLPIAKMRWVETLADLRFSEIRAAIVIVYATWAGPSLSGLDRLKILSSCDLNSLEIIVVDTDCFLDYVPYFGRELHGCGETFLVKNGKMIVEISPHRMSDDLILKHTKELLNDAAWPSS